MKAFLKNHRQSPRKVRLVTDAVKGQSVDQALVTLSLMQKRATTPIAAAIRSAAANAKAQGVDMPGTLIVSDIRVDKGMIMTRYMPQARGRAVPYRIISSHVSIALAAPKGMRGAGAVSAEKPAKAPVAKKAKTTTRKKAAAKK